MSENYDKIVPAIRVVLRDKLEAFDQRKAEWNRVMERGETMMPVNGEQAEAYFMQADEMQDLLTDEMSHIMRLRALLSGAKKAS